MRCYESLGSALVGELRHALGTGTKVAPRGRPTLEVTDCAFRLENPRARLIAHPERRWSAAYAVGELLWHLRGSDDVSIISYYALPWKGLADASGKIPGSCYGHKLFAREGESEISQWARLRETLLMDIESRRAVVTLYDGTIDLGRVAEDVSCTCLLQFLVRHGLLNLIGFMRSNDLYLGVGYDVFLFTMLQELLANDLGLEVGWYQHTVGSAHIYEKDLDRAEMVAQLPARDVAPMRRLESPEAIRDVLAYEELIRSAQQVDPEIEFGVSSYWKEMLWVLLAHRLARNGDKALARRVASRLEGSAFSQALGTWPD